MNSPSQEIITSFDSRRNIATPGNKEKTVAFCVQQFIEIANESIAMRNRFTVALSGGSTPKAIFSALVQPENKKQIDWSKVWIFWGDERNVSLDHADSNYKMAMESGLATVGIPKSQIFPMESASDPEKLEENARKYEKLIQEHTAGQFDLVMLGMGEDGHTASLFPKTHALRATEERLVVANFVPQKECWRTTLTFSCINAARNISLYALGKSKQQMLYQIFTQTYNPDELPSQEIGTPTNKVLWIADQEASDKIKTVIG